MSDLPRYAFLPPPPPAPFEAPGGAEGRIADLLTHIIRDAHANSPRSRQKAIGPSEIGHACARRLGYRLNDTQPVNTGTDPWASIVGTAVHAWLAEAFTGANTPGAADWLTEARVDVADGLRGTSDLMHVPSRTVLDWKIVGETVMRRVKADGPSHAYRVQVHAYGVGFLHRGLLPARVGIVFIPRGGRLDGMHVWSEPFDPAVAADAVTRLDGIRTLVGAAGTSAITLLPTADGPCSWCPFHRAGATDLTTACPGHDALSQAAPHPTAA